MRMKKSDKTESEGPSPASDDGRGLDWQMIYTSTQLVCNSTVRPELKGKGAGIAVFFPCRMIIS